ncbi:unnamed protein product [Bursaphelenchus xylophilus]|uniref:(pine wood nematode) hypothetical protein n=1 Tax=Bursaphelenchus xylophilus TaxID=6326 RepID=A0A1I7SUL3_BURXY|nr:unnamed protein product [Bursaphelenchus xylophilus]CAG9118603.1 unnamed protein product [Bursaphelenchus xylophilus]
MLNNSKVLLSPAFGLPITAIVSKQEVKEDKIELVNEDSEDESQSAYPKYSLCSLLYIYGLFLMVSFILSVGFYQLISTDLHGSGASLRNIPAVDNTFVAFGTTSEPAELLKVLFAAQIWRNLGVRSIVALIGEPELYQEGPNKMLVNVLRQMEAELVYVENANVHEDNMAKLMPFYVTATNVSQDLYEDTVIILANTDYIPLDLASHLPQTEKAIEVKIYDAKCCDVLNLGDLQLHKYSMNTVAMTLKRWQEVFALDRQMSVDAIENQITQNFGDFIVLGAQSQAFYAKELAFAVKFEQWKNKVKGASYLVDVLDHKNIHRLNSQAFNSHSTSFLKTLPLSVYNDILIDDRLHDSDAWNVARVFYRRFFTHEQYEYLLEVRERVISWQKDEQQRHWALWMNLYNPSI